MELDKGIDDGGAVAEPASCTNCIHMSVCGMAARLNAHLQGFASGGLVKQGSKKEMQEHMNDFEVAATAAQAACCDRYRYDQELAAV